MYGHTLEYDNHYERDCKTQHDGSHDEQNDPELGNGKDPAIERKNGELVKTNGEPEEKFKDPKGLEEHRCRIEGQYPYVPTESSRNRYQIEYRQDV